MKNLTLVISIFWMAIIAVQPNKTLAQVCCPDFIMKDAVEICPPEGSCTSDPVGFQHAVAACKVSAHTYTVYPNDPSFTYTWTVTGGTPSLITGNPNIIFWGNGATGFIKVVITSNNPNLNCKDSILQEICLLDGPSAAFTILKDTVCVYTPVIFTNTSSGGTVFVWNMGDGTIYTTPNPPNHSYSAPGTYTVTLTATDMGAGHYVGGGTNGGELKVPCGCSDTATRKVVVLPGVGPTIETDCCYGTVCPGDTSSFCTSMVCNTFNWSVTNGTIISGAGTSCIQVKWDNVYTVPTTVTLQSCASSTCPGSTTLNVPVLYPNLPIAGPTILCIGASGTYSLPLLPGTFYKWTVTGGSYSFNQQDRNVAIVNISFNTPGSYWVKCEYNNPLAGCNGVDSIQVNVLPKLVIYGLDKVCEGNPTFFSSNGASTWTFSPAGPTILSGQGTQNVVISWPPGNYILTATALNPSVFCNPSATKKVQVIAKPILANITGPDSVCTGNKYAYAITSNTSGSPFVWSVISGTGTIVSQMGDDNDSILVQFSGPGTWTLQVYQEIEITPGVFCQSLNKTKIVHPFLPPNIAGNHTVCVDAIENYIAGGSNPPGGHQWSITPSSQGTIQSGQGSNSVFILWHGPANTATVTVSTCSGTDTVHVIINDPPIATASANMTPLFCLHAAQTLVISTPNISGYTFQWFKNNVFTGVTTSSISINVATAFTLPGTYSYYVLVTHNGCTIKSNLVNVIIEDCSLIPIDTTQGCPAHAYFRAYVLCDQITLINQSIAVFPATITNYQWTLSPNTGTFTPNANSPTPLLVVTASGLYAITLTVTSSTGCITSWTEYVNVLLPNATFTFTTPVCENVPASFSASPNNPNYNYAWYFGDGYTSYTPNTQHAYASAAFSPYYVNLVITDNMGCIATALDTITVNPTPVCTITAWDTIFCPGSFAVLSACSGMSSYQWYRNGNPVSGATNDTIHANKIGEYQVEVTNSYGCTNKSNKIYIYMHQSPKANITGDAYFCETPGGTVGFSLSTIFNVNYSYNWSSLPAGASFSPPNSNSPYITLTLPFTLPAYYQFIVDVTDVTTLCMKSDTICVTFYETPALSIVSIPALDVCEGIPVTLIPNINNTSLYSYQWSNGATTPVITVSTPGFYYLTITDKATGCSATANAGSIHSKPDLRLFPIGCAKLCAPDTLHLYIPLPLNWLPPNNTYASAYPNINWYDNGNYGTPVGNGPQFNYPAGTSGNHQFSVVVENSFGCVDTAGVFCLSSSCCDIILESLEHHNALCPEYPNGWFTIVLDPASTGGPFNITSVPLVAPFPTTITAGNPLTVNNLPAGSYTIIVTGPNEGCSQSYNVLIENNKDACCMAEADSLFNKILVNTTYSTDMVWDGKWYIDDNVILTVTNGSILDITNVDVVFGECAGIVFTNGALLRSNNSVYRPCYIDGTWKGLRFVGKGKFDNIINECTFKNAEVALYFQAMADGVVSNNLFSNCNYGVRVENNNSFNHPIDGNRFVTEQFFPSYNCTTKYSFVNNSSAYGIYSTSSRFLQQVSQNSFVNTWGNALPRTYGIYQVKGGGVLSNNTFTDLSYSILLSSALFPTILENNKIEINELVNNTVAPVYITICNSPVIEINNNTISDNYHQYNCFSAIYAKSSSNLSISANKINGFQYGIYASTARNFQISSNDITDCDVVGIYFNGKGNYKNYITCNDVKMRNFTNTRGLYTVDLTPLSEISSNCFNDSYTSMDFHTVSGAALPKIRNNFLYNYNYVGINVVGYSGNIGTLSPPDPGLNTLWSNYNPAIDINSNTNITVADNFGMFNISWPQVQIVSNRPFHSTASCAQQIFNMPSQGNLNVNYTCDNYKNLFTPLLGSGGLYNLVSDYKEQLRSSENQYDDADLILASIEPADPGLIDEIISVTSLTENEKSLLKYNYYYRNADFANARLNISQLAPADNDEADYKTLCLYDLDIIEHGWDFLSESDFNSIGMIKDKGSYNTTFAISLLNNSSTYRDYPFDVVQLPDVLASSEVKHVENGDNFLSIRPNPATDKVYIELAHNSLSECKIQLFDVSGKLVTNYTASFLTGSIELDIRSLREGFYFVTLTDSDSGSVKTGKLIKVR
jgi:PKD repeat protein